MEEATVKILIVEPADYSSAALEMYASLGEVLLYPQLGVDIDEAIDGVHTIVVRLQRSWTAGLLSYAKQLKYIVSPTTGLDHIDTAYCREHGIDIISLQGETNFLTSIPSTAELTWGLLLALIRNIPAANQHVKLGEWDRNLFKGNNLSGKTLGIVGLGRVGKQVSAFAHAFQMNVCAYDPFTNHWMEGVEKKEAMADLLNHSDIISIHIPAAGNDLFLSGEVLDTVKPGAVFINTSRGSVWDEAMLAQMLKEGRIKGLATDVIHHEQEAGERAGSPLLRAQRQGYNCIITPHIAGATHESMHATEDFVAKKWLSALQKA